MNRFAENRVVITAAAGGIARRVAERFYAEGAHIFAGDVDIDGLSTLPEDIGTALCNVADAGSVTAFFQAAQTYLSGIDILIAAAGTKGPTGPIEETDPADWKACLDVSLMGTYHCLHQTLGPMKQQGHGRIITFSSTAGLFGYPNRSPYSAAKWAIIGLSKTAAAEAGPFGVQVNTICPGAVEGDRMDRVIAAEATTTGKTETEIREEYVKDTSMRCFVSADDIAETILFLCSKAGARISGQAIPVDGHTSML